MTQKLTMEEQQLIGLLCKNCKTPGDITRELKRLFSGTLETLLEAEMEEHLGYEKHSVEGNNSGNSRNGYNRKIIKSEWGEHEIAVPRDRNGTFEPVAVEKRQTRTDEIEQRILAMYARGMTTRDIEEHLREIYGVEASAGLISSVTNKILPEMEDWRSRPLEEIYPVVFFDGIVFKSRNKDNRVVNKCAYTVLGINMDGMKDILGIWVAESESASFWTSVFNELRNRGVRDIFIACHDNLTGFCDALQTVYPKTENQLCIIHMLRNSTKYVSYKDLKEVTKDLKKVYTAATEDGALYALEEFREKWGKKYPQILKSWDDNWSNLSGFFKYPEELRRLIYTTNAVEGFHRQLRKYTKTRTIFPTDDSLKKAIYLAVQEISKKWSMPHRDWGIIYGQMTVFFADRLVTGKSA